MKGNKKEQEIKRIAYMSFCPFHLLVEEEFLAFMPTSTTRPFHFVAEEFLAF